jgi:iron complex outermembrane receptor protein
MKILKKRSSRRQNKLRPGRWRATVVAVLACVGLYGVHAQAEESNLLDLSLEELVDYRLTSMSRKEQRVEDTAAAAYVITGEELRRSGALSIPEALRMVPGLNVAQISRDSWAVSSRGFMERFSSKLLVLVDGRSIYSPMFSGVLWETQDTLMEDIERIEVIRGPGAALWGTNAMNGVINIVTRKAKATQGNLLSTQIGQGGYGALSLRHGGELEGGGHYRLYGKTDTMNGSPETATGLTGIDGAAHQRVGVRIEPMVQGGELSVKAEAYRLRSQSLYLTPTVLAYSSPGTPFQSATPERKNGEGALLQARYSWRTADGAQSVLQAYVDRESLFHEGLLGSGTGLTQPYGVAPAFARFGGEKTDIDVDYQRRQVWGVHDVIWGLALRHTVDDLRLPAGPYLLLDGKDSRTSYSAFIHDDVTLIPERLKFIWGSKFERDGLTGSNVQPNVRMLWTPNSSDTVWGALSRSVRSPRRIESLATIDIAALDPSVVSPLLPSGLTAMLQMAPRPGASVMAEKALSLEAGWRKQLGPQLSFDSAIYLNDYSDLRGGRLVGASPQDSAPGIGQSIACLISNPFNPPQNCYFTIQGYNTNQDKFRTWGGEFAVDWHPNSQWRVQGAYAYLHAQGVLTGDLIGDSQIKAYEGATPQHQLSLRSNYSFGQGLNLDLWARRVSATKHYALNAVDPFVIHAYVSLDARLAWQVDRQLELAVMGKNLLTNRHAEFADSFPYTRAYDVQRTLFLTALWRF